jgi:YbbR domain-containing protein
VEYGNRPSNLEILDTSVNQVHLQVKGPSALLKSLRPDQVEVRIDLRRAVNGKNSFPLTRQSITLPPGVLLSKVDPSTVEITLDKPITKELPVQVNWVGRLPDWSVIEAKVIPETVKVIGGSKLLENTATIYTAPVRLENLSKSGVLSVPLVLVPPSLKLDSNSKDRVVIEYTLGERQEGKKRE